MKLRWIDIAKGLAIFLVVLGHARSKVFIEMDGPSAIVDAWSGVGGVLPIIRMPLFFAISGILAAKAVTRPWHAVVRPRVLNIYWVYAIWLIIGTLTFSFFQSFDTSIPRSPERFISELFVGTSYLWYLYALIAYFVLIKCLYRFRVPVLAVGVLGCLVISADVLSFHVHGNLQSMVRSFVFFALGVYFGGTIKRHVESRAATITFIGGVAGVALLVAANVSGARWLDAFASASLLMAILGLCRLVSEYVPAAVEYVGRNTLPVYVMHVPLLAACHAIVPLVPVPLNGALFALSPVLLALLAVVTCLVVHRALVSMRLGFLFQLPGGPHRPSLEVSNAHLRPDAGGAISSDSQAKL